MPFLPVNNFYTPWDCETLGDRQTQDIEYRNAFEIDRDRIIHSTAFRRLQGKTQVYVTGRSDQYRTRLTHSIEVAQIGRSLVNLLNRNSSELNAEFYLDAALVEAACLAHDLGNPPIGHRGESMLNDLMDPYGGFEGNAQSLRILTYTLRGDHRGTAEGGMHATRACLDAILKYKIVGKENTPNQAKFLYHDQLPILEWVHENAGVTHRSQGGEKIRSIESNIMDQADDIAYTTSDLFDGFKQGLVTETLVREFLNDQEAVLENELWENFLSVLSGEHSMARFGAYLIGRWLKSTRLVKRENAPLNSNRYTYDIEMGNDAREELELFRRLNFALIYRSEFVRVPEAEGVAILEELFRYYQELVLGKTTLIPGLELTRSAADPDLDVAQRMRHICDWVSGMTDLYALRKFEILKQAG